MSLCLEGTAVKWSGLPVFLSWLLVLSFNPGPNSNTGLWMCCGAKRIVPVCGNVLSFMSLLYVSLSICSCDVMI